MRALIGSFLALLLLIGMHQNQLAEASPPAEFMILFSIDGNYYEEGKQPVAKEKFQTFPVLGKVEITTPAEKKVIHAALKEGLETKAEPARCFLPRHGLRVRENGRTIDYAICFECNRVRIVGDGEPRMVSFASTPEATFNRILKAAKVPLAPKQP